MTKVPLGPSTEGNWHSADLDGLYVVRDRDCKVIFTHQPDFSKGEKVANVILAAAAKELLETLKCLLEVSYTSEEASKIRGYVATENDLRREQKRAAELIDKVIYY